MKVNRNTVIELLVNAARVLIVNPALTYHNWDHVNKVYQTYVKFWGDPHLEVAAAILFHDIVYVPGAPNGMNEKMSGLLLQNLAQHILGSQYTQEDFDVEFSLEIIEATTVDNHIAPDYRPASYYIARMMDCDLASLADPYPQFVFHQNNLVSEMWGPGALLDIEQHAQYRQRQVAFLMKFLDSERQYIYHTPEARQNLEDAARYNISRFADEWGQQ